MKVYPQQSPGSSAIGASAGAVDPKTHCKWVLAFTDAIINLVAVVVTKLQCEDATDCGISKNVEGWPVARPLVSFFPGTPHNAQLCWDEPFSSNEYYCI